MMTHKTAPATMLAVLILRALVGPSSRLSQPSQPESIGSEPDWRNASTNVALINYFGGGPLMIATADAPMRKRSTSGFSTSMRTGKRCATRTQFSSRLTYGTPDGGRSSSPSGFTAQPIPCTFPRKRWLGADERKTIASLPGAMCRTSASRKFAMTYHLLVSSNEKMGTPVVTWAPAEMLRLMTRPEKGAMTLQ